MRRGNGVVDSVNRWLAAPALVLFACRAPAAETEPLRYRVDPGEPMATVDLVIDLRASAHCEEDLDLVLYREVAVQMLAWDDRHGACRERFVRIKFIPERMSKPALLTRVRALTLRAEERSGP